MHHLFLQDTTDETEIIESKDQLEPYILVLEDRALLVVDNHVIGEVESQDYAIALLSSYFVFHICYMNGCSNYFSFLEVSLLDGKNNIPITVDHLFSAVKSH